MTLRATTLRVTRWLATHTSPIPPSPTRRSRRYRPDILLPGACSPIAFESITRAFGRSCQRARETRHRVESTSANVETNGYPVRVYRSASEDREALPPPGLFDD